MNETNESMLAAEAAWVQRASQGDHEALTQLYERYIDQVYRYCFSRVRNVYEAEALTSETFTRAVEALLRNHYKLQGKPFGAWLYGIAANVLQERNRRLKNGPPVLEEVDSILEDSQHLGKEGDVLDSIIREEERDALWRLVDELPAVEQSVLVLRHVYGLSYAEIAERLGRSEPACKQVHYRALRKLKLLAQETDQWSEIREERR